MKTGRQKKTVKLLKEMNVKSVEIIHIVRYISRKRLSRLREYAKSTNTVNNIVYGVWHMVIYFLNTVALPRRLTPSSCHKKHVI